MWPALKVFINAANRHYATDTFSMDGMETLMAGRKDRQITEAKGFVQRLRSNLPALFNTSYKDVNIKDIKAFNAWMKNAAGENFDTIVGNHSNKSQQISAMKTYVQWKQQSPEHAREARVATWDEFFEASIANNAESAKTHAKKDMSDGFKPCAPNILKFLSAMKN